MYTPKIYKAPNAQAVKNFLKKYDFASLISAQDDYPIATHIPLSYDESHNRLVGHISVANEQKAAFEQGAAMLCIFSEAHSYVSSSWYEHINVPTWNYIAVHIKGHGTVLTAEETMTHLRDLTQQYEAGRENAFSMDDMPERMLDSHLRGLIGVAVDITDVEASFKLSQNRNDKDYQEIIKQLSDSDDYLSQMIAEEMAKLR